jgi:hypothetical protein
MDSVPGMIHGTVPSFARKNEKPHEECKDGQWSGRDSNRISPEYRLDAWLQLRNPIRYPYAGAVVVIR